MPTLLRIADIRLFNHSLQDVSADVTPSDYVVSREGARV